MAPVKSIPERYQSVVPQLRVQNPERLIEIVSDQIGIELASEDL